MKRVIPILAALCLVVAMAVPVFAADASFSLAGKWIFNQVLTPFSLSSYEERVNFRAYNSFTEKTYLENGFRFYGDELKFVQYVDGTLYGFSSVYGFVNNEWSSTYPYAREIDFGNVPQPVTEEFYQWVVSNAVRQNCDSSVCSSVDADGDGYCDNCGGFFTPPPPGPLVEVMTDLKEQNQLSRLLMPVVTMIPIGLGCWVGYKGLRKALDLLVNVLHQA